MAQRAGVAGLHTVAGAERRRRLRVLWHGLPLLATMLGFLYYWFAVADRYRVFLYFHDMGPLVPDTSPFSPVTRSRYWMAGLVASGLVMVLYGSANWLWGRLAPRYEPPSWWRVWLPTAALLAPGTVLITFTGTEPRLPLGVAVQVAFAAVVGLGLALLPGRWAARKPRELLLLIVDGGGLAGLMLSLSFLGRAADYAGRGLRWPFLIVSAGIAAGALLMLIMSAVHVWRRRVPRTIALFTAALSVAYLFLPALHHVGFTDGYYYISDAQNFFAGRWVLQVAAWLVTGGVTLGVSSLRRRLLRRMTDSTLLLLLRKHDCIDQ